MSSVFAVPPKVAAQVSANGTLGKGRLTPVSAAAAPVAMTLPAGAAQGAVILVQKADATANAVSVTGNIRGVAATTVTLTSQYELIAFIADTNGSWWPTGGHRTKAADVAAYAPITHTHTASQVTDFTEVVEDVVAAMLGRSTNVGISWTYTDNGTGLGTLAANVTGGGSGTLDAEAARDAVDAQLVGVNGVSVVVNDAADTVTFSITSVSIAQVSGLQAALNSKAAAGFDGLLPGATITVLKDPTTGFWPASYGTDGTPVYTGGSTSAGVRPTSRTDIFVHWKGPDPSPGIVASGTGGMLDGKDVRLVTA